MWTKFYASRETIARTMELSSSSQVFPYMRKHPCQQATAAHHQHILSNYGCIRCKWTCFCTDGTEMKYCSPLKRNALQFSKDLEELAALEACNKDIQEVKNRGISRFPSLLFTAVHHRQSVTLTGYRPYEGLEKIIEKLMHGDMKSER
ncbi:hypothetical protein HF329_16885 [Chitinophaga oryzae]|uniref:Thioredoxin-like fold domain-containing protein n=1 Tax=Chitinophaga oryzae TaxID=2725414 RepID=A0AAE6ZIR2_9BACT|nr:hypothetical protein [Chitinophaga oryzae]QJB32902.1 hypothetical protein HF329_16885 [Chitinophaga oryzae]